MATKNDNIRYGVSALSMKYLSYAVNDEILIDEVNGKIYYKRPDGVIVSFDALDFDKNSIVSGVRIALKKHKDAIISANDNLVYYKLPFNHNIATNGKISITNDTAKHLVSGNTHGFFIRVRGNNIINTVMAYLTSRLHVDNKISDYNTVTIEYKVYSGSSSTGTNMTTNVNFNKLTYVPITGRSTANDLRIQITGITFTGIQDAINDRTVISEEVLNELKALNNGNALFETEMVDLMYFVPRSDKGIDDSTIKKNKMELVLNLPTEDLDLRNEVDSVVIRDGFDLNDFLPTIKTDITSDKIGSAIMIHDDGTETAFESDTLALNFIPTALR